MIYTTGTVSTVSGSAIVSGTGTKWTVNNPAIRAGTLILIQNGNMNYPYMVDRVNSDTELVISQPATFTVKNTDYSINLTEPNTYSDANNRMTAIASDTTYFLRAMDQWMMNNGVVTVELANGQKITLDSIKKMQEDISNKADDNKTVHIGDFGIGAVNRLYSKNLNDVMVSGDYQQDATNEATLDRNYPIKEAGALKVFQTVGNWASGGCVQEYTTYLSARKFIRVRASANWYPWEEMPNRHSSETQRFNGQLMSYQGLYSLDKSNPTNYFGLLRAEKGVPYGLYLSYDGSGYSVRFPERKGGTLMLVGDYGVGGVGLREPSGVSCFYGIASSGVAGFPSNGAGFQSTYQQNRRAMLFVNTSGDLLVRFSLSDSIADTTTPWRTVWSSNNTTIDSNGFIKRASPIININPDGTYTTNDESEGATVTRISEGEYLIEGVLGFNSDAGWGGVDGGIEIPLDVNKQPLIWVDSRIVADGSIRVRTYHRTHPNAPKFARNDIEGYSGGDLIDIPDGRFISVRVQMPEQSIYNVRMREMEEAQKAEEERRQKEEEMKAQFGLSENDELF